MPSVASQVVGLIEMEVAPSGRFEPAVICEGAAARPARIGRAEDEGTAESLRARRWGETIVATRVVVADLARLSTDLDDEFRRTLARIVKARRR